MGRINGHRLDEKPNPAHRALLLAVEEGLCQDVCESAENNV